MLDKKAFATMLATFSDLCGKKLQLSTVDVYYNVLKNYETEHVIKASEIIIKKHKFNTIPQPAVFVEILEGNISGQAGEAWGLVLESVRLGERGHTKNVLANKVVSLLGGLGGLTTEERPFVMNRFIGLYKDLALKHQIEDDLKLIDINKDNINCIEEMTKSLVKD